ncbi:4-(cytidine 5'-diphospho)-2-C-methyl-D-erythritol kinase, partial [Candidatus Micrarchaeota archaeon]|nr:4-(cytidine 5'-diphospho)-2-C-methyl-D-erythritol kinase [Candidatus Micrarchaeota archaeon]
MKKNTINSPAKVNLTLDIIKKREDGYHELEMVMQELELKDEIVLEEIEKNEIRIRCILPEVPINEKNLCWKAAEIIKEKKDIKKGILIRIKKKIPVAGGLGGGSSNAAATIKGLNELWELNLEEKEMQEIAEQIGMDVAFFLYGGTAFAEGRGEKIKKIKSFPKTKMIVCNPGIPVSTKTAYSNIDYEKSGKVLASRKLKQAIEQGKETKELIQLIHNDFEFSVFRDFPKIEKLKEEMQENSLNVLMSGSGSTVFCFPKENEAKK